MRLDIHCRPLPSHVTPRQGGKPVTPEVVARTTAHAVRSLTCGVSAGRKGNDLQLLLAIIEPRRAGMSAIE